MIGGKVGFRTALLGSATLLALAVAAPARAQGQATHFEIAAQPAADALNEWARQAKIQIVFPYAQVAGRKAPAIRGDMTPRQALNKLIFSLGLRIVTDRGDRISLSATGRATPGEAEAGQAPADGESVSSLGGDADPDNQAGISEILVVGSRSQNVDIRRTKDDVLPYVVFERSTIERSGAQNLEQFFRTRLPMNTASVSLGQGTGEAINFSGINLRGLGANQTLILVDGRRVPGIGLGTDITQPDINGIPVDAVERIEVLPSTAGGIYGGSAIGGVINIVLKRDYRGISLRAAYGDTFDGAAKSVRFDLNGGFTLFDGHTRVMLGASHSDSDTLRLGDRDFAERGLALQLANNPAAVYNASTPIRGATANIRSSTGTPLVLDNGTALNSAITYVPLGYAGGASDGGMALVANAGKYSLALPAGAAGADRGLLAGARTNALTFNVRQDLVSWLEAFVDLSYYENSGRSFDQGNVGSSVFGLPANAPNNPFQQSINVSFPIPGLAFPTESHSSTVRAVGGLIAKLPYHWTGEFDYGWNRSRSQAIATIQGTAFAADTAFRTGLPAPDGRPALDALKDANTSPFNLGPYLLPSPNYYFGPFESVMQNATLRLSGPLLQLPAGPINLTALADHRKEEREATISQNVDGNTGSATYTFWPKVWQKADSVYLEARIPLFSSNNAVPLLKELEVQASVRHDEYRTTGLKATQSAISVPSRNGPFPGLNYATSRLASTDYTIGLRYKPIADLVFRASYGTGFRPPALSQIASETRTTIGFLGLDPKRGNTDKDFFASFTQIYGGNPDLKPELSKSWSVGSILTPSFLPGFRASLDFTQISKSNEFQTPSTQFILDNEAAFPGRIVRGPNLPGDPVGWAGPITSFNQSLVNIAKSKVQAYDIQVDYLLKTRSLGDFQWSVLATHELHYKNQLLPTNPVIEFVGFTGGPLAWRANGGVTWYKGPLTVNWNMQFYDSYRVYTATASTSSRDAAILNQGANKIPYQIYNDIAISYRFSAGDSSLDKLLGGSEVSLIIQNIFDKSPPILATTSLSSGGYSTYGDPRLRRFLVSLRKSFGGHSDNR